MKEGEEGGDFLGLTNKGVEVNLAELICYEDFRESRYSLSLSIYIYIHVACDLMIPQWSEAQIVDFGRHPKVTHIYLFSSLPWFGEVYGGQGDGISPIFYEAPGRGNSWGEEVACSVMFGGRAVFLCIRDWLIDDDLFFGMDISWSLSWIISDLWE